MKQKIRLMAVLWPMIYLIFMCAEARAQDPAPGSALSGKDTLDISRDTLQIEEVEINAGYYTTTDKYRTGNIGRVTAKEIDKQPVSNPLLALHGRIPGVIVNQNSGVPGTALNIQIRGQNSLRTEGNHPLYIVDGIPLDSEPIMSPNIGILVNDGMDVLNAVNPQNIANIEILKDADATAIYGSRGANGVVLITTKKGEVGRPRLNGSLTSGFSNVPKIKLLNTDQYLEMRREAFANDDRQPTGADLLSWDEHRYTDWQKELLGNTANMNDVQLALSGGQGGTIYRISGGWRKESMVFPGDMGHNLSSVGLHVGQKAFMERLQLNLSANYGSVLNRTSPHNFVQNALSLPPNAPRLFNEDGTYNWEGNTWVNPMAALEKKHTLLTDNLNVNATISYRVFGGLSLKANLGFGTIHTEMVQKNPIKALNPSNLGATGSAWDGYDRQKRWLVEPQILYVTGFKRLSVEALLGATFQHNESSTFQMTTSGYINDALIGNTAAASSMLITQDDIRQYRYNAAFARVGLRLDDRYLLNLTARRDGSSRFGPGKRFGNFGAIGAAWIISKEPFARELGMVSFLKLRGSYGTTGNDKVGDYGYLDTYSIGNFRGQTSLNPTQLFNPTYAWEVNHKLDLELDVRFFDDQLSLNVNWFRNTSSNQLVGYSLPAITGFNSVQANLPATVENKGWEFMVGMDGKSRGKFQWQSSLNLSIPRNRLLAYPDIENSSYANTYVVGKGLSVRRLYEFVGLNEDGLYELRDVNGDGRFDMNDRHIVKEIRRVCYGGLQTTFQYGQLSFNLMLEGVLQNGADGMLGINGWPGQTNQNQPVYVLNRWRESHKHTSVQRYTTLANQNTNFQNTRNSNLNIVDASFIRIRNITLGYKLDDDFLDQLSLASCEIFIHGQNLFTFTGYQGWDAANPRAARILPTLRTYSFGIRVGI